MKFMIYPAGSFITSEVKRFQADRRTRWASKLDRFRQTARQIDRQIVSKPAGLLIHDVLGQVEQTRSGLSDVPRTGKSKIRYFCPDGAWAFELLGLGLLAS